MNFSETSKHSLQRIFLLVALVLFAAPVWAQKTKSAPAPKAAPAAHASAPKASAPASKDKAAD